MDELPSWLPMFIQNVGNSIKVVANGHKYLLNEFASIYPQTRSVIEYYYVPKSPKRVKLPDKITTDLAYIVGYHFGDGYLEDTDKTIHRKGKADYEITYADKNRGMIQIIVSMFQRLFNVAPKVSKRGNMFVARLYSKIIHAFLQYVLKLHTGKKQTERIPDYINQDIELLRHFIRGFFDAEGYMYFDRYNKKVRLGVTNSNLPLLHEIKDNLLNAFHIRILGPYKKHKQECWDLKIFKLCDIKKYIAKIGFNHPRKRNFLSFPLLAEGAT